MSENLETCVDPYLDSFAESFAAANYKASTIDHYRYLAGKLGRAMDAAGISPSALTPNVAESRCR
jgi:integrase/recombinase XerD